MTTERFFKILNSNGYSNIDELECSPTKKAIAKKLTAQNAESEKLDCVIRMSGLDIPKESDPAAVLMTAAHNFIYMCTEYGTTDDKANAADLFGTMAGVADREPPKDDHRGVLRDAIAEFEAALNAYPYSLEGMFQNGLNQPFCKAYDLYTYYKRTMG